MVSTKRTSRTSRTTRTNKRGANSLGPFLSFVAVIVVGCSALYFYIDAQRKSAEEKLNKKARVVAAAIDLERGKMLEPMDLRLIQIPYAAFDTSRNFTSIEDPRLSSGVLLTPVFGNQPILVNMIGEKKQIEKPRIGGQEIIERQGVQMLLTREGESPVDLALTGNDATQSFLELGRKVTIFREFNTKRGNLISKRVSAQARIIGVKKADSLFQNAQQEVENKTFVTLAVPREEGPEVQRVAAKRQIKIVDGHDREAPRNQVHLMDVYTGFMETGPESLELSDEVGTSLIASSVGSSE